MEKKNLKSNDLMCINLLVTIMQNYTRKVLGCERVWGIGYDFDDDVYYSTIDYRNNIDVYLRKDEETYLLGIRYIVSDTTGDTHYEYIGSVLLPDLIIKDATEVIITSIKQYKEGLDDDYKGGLLC